MDTMDVFVVFKWRCDQCGETHEDFAKKVIFLKGQTVVCMNCGYIVNVTSC